VSGSVRPRAGPPTPAPPASLPVELAELLHRARDREASAVGAGRVAAFRLTRALLGGARAAGYSVRQLADCLAVSPSSMRARCYSDDWVNEAVFAELAGLDAAVVQQWLLPGGREAGHRQARAAALIVALVRPVSDCADDGAGEPTW
jgi:hypothetical protein